MADIQDTDQFLVNRSDSTATVPASDLMADLLDDDLMLVNRSDVTYTVTGADVKASLGGGGAVPIYPEPDEVTGNPDFQGGTGTELDPYILAPITVAPAGEFGVSVEVITIDVAGAQEGQLVVWTDNSVGAGNRFEQPTGVVGADGTWTGRVVYRDVPNTASNTDYVGDLQIGDVYFRWTVTQKLVAGDPPEIGSVTLTEQNAGQAPRFTNQSFVVAVEMTEEGFPLSTKVIDAYVEGTIDGVDSTRKYLEFNSAGTVTDLLDSPQDPPYSVLAANPTLTLTFPATFSSGKTPDEELGEGVSLTACVTAENTVESVGPACETVTPEQEDAEAVIKAKPGYLTAIRTSDTSKTIDDTIKHINILKTDNNMIAVSEDGKLWWYHLESGSWQDKQLIADVSPAGFPWESIAGDWSNTDLLAKDSDGNLYNYQPFSYASQTIPILDKLVDTNIANIGNCGTYSYVLWTQAKTDEPEVKLWNANKLTTFNFAGLSAYDDTKIKQVMATRGPSGSSGAPSFNYLIILTAKGNLYTVGAHPSEFTGIDPSGTVANPKPWNVNFVTGGVPISSINSPSTIYSQQDISFRDNNGKIYIATSKHQKYGSMDLFAYRPDTSFLSNPYGVWAQDYVFIEKDGKVYVENGSLDNSPKTYIIDEPNLGLQGGVAYGHTPSVYSEANQDNDGNEIGVILFSDDPNNTMTAGQLAEQKLKFETYENRAAVHQGEQAMAAREALVKELKAKGIDAAEALKTKAKRGRRKKAD